jgi:hypothetical protein
VIDNEVVCLDQGYAIEVEYGLSYQLWLIYVLPKINVLQYMLSSKVEYDLSYGV